MSSPASEAAERTEPSRRITMPGVKSHGITMPDGWTWTVIALAIAALVIRLIGLGDRALHHDESLHAIYSWYLAEGRGYSHDPLMHGPFQFHVIAGFFKIFGDSDFTARLPHALMGSGLVLTPLLLRRWLGGPGVVLAALFLAISPSLLYYSRFARNDIPVALFTILMFASVWRYRDDGQLRWLVLLSAGLALSFASKETAYLTAAVLLLYLNALVGHELFEQRHREESVGPGKRILHALWLIPVAWVIAALWRPLARVRARYGLSERPRSVDLLVVTGTLVLPLLSAFIVIPWERFVGELSGPDERALGTMTVVILLAASAAVGLVWDMRRWSVVAAVMLAILLPLYMTFGTNPEGVAGAFWTSLAYWIEQHDVQRGDQPWFYYVMLIPFYETLTLVPALIGGLWLLIRRRDGFAAMLLFWFAGTFIALSIAGEKMPWLTVPIALPLAFLAAHALGRVMPRVYAGALARSGSMLQWMATGLAIGVGAMLLAHTIWSDINLNIRHPDTPLEPLIYVQSSPDIPVLSREIHSRLESGEALGVFIDQTASLSWPWAWYLRGTAVQYGSPEFLRGGSVGDGMIVIAAQGSLPAESEVRERYTDHERYRHRWWFPEDRYRHADWGGFVNGMVTGSWPSAWLEFAISRLDEEQVGILWGEVLFP
jgi:uncharacterized protein (TIGR03663 family)